MLLRHLHCPGLSKYGHAALLQQKLVATFLASKAAPQSIQPPPPTIITAEFEPVYTCGRREVNDISHAQIDFLTETTPHGSAEFQKALRGGQMTFHGPGQLIAYLILDLKQHNLGVRDYVCLLEKTVIRLCRERYGIDTRTTEHPGVWVDDMQKICALGVHLRRNITSHGIALNVSTELAWFDRIVACGLEGKQTTSLTHQGLRNVSVQQAGQAFVKLISERLGAEEICTRNVTPDEFTDTEVAASDI